MTTPINPNPRLNELMKHRDEDRPTPILQEAGTPLIEIKSGLLRALPKYYGLTDEDPYSFLSDFIKAWRIQRRPVGVTEDQFKLTALPFALTSDADMWFTSLPSNSIRTWVEIKRAFLDNYFLSTRVEGIQFEISSIKQAHYETLHAYWSRYKRLCDSFPNHGYSETDILKFFYKGMTNENKNLINTACGGEFMSSNLDDEKRILKKLIRATREYDEPQLKLLQKVANTQEVELQTGKIDARVDKLEKLVIDSVEKIQEGANSIAQANQA